MLAWWFANIDGEIEVDGKRYPRYLIWHPYDHISFSCTRLADGSVGPGVRFTITEAFAADESLRVHTRDQVDLLDETGLRLSARAAGLEVFSLHHRFTREGAGTQYDSTMMVGVPGALGRMFNPLIAHRLFSERHGQAWLKHNIEEVGLLDHLVPRLRGARPTGHYIERRPQAGTPGAAGIGEYRWLSSNAGAGPRSRSAWHRSSEGPPAASFSMVVYRMGAGASPDPALLASTDRRRQPRSGQAAHPK